jgi:beta-glucosidase/6-phospho-beta-glucosidase/beta-galactosidase
VNEGGMDFYERLVDTLLDNGIEPVPTLFHWDLPIALDDRGGWLNPDVADWFADYAGAMYRRLDGRVKKWTTLNEPWVVADGGYLHGALAPATRTSTRRRSRRITCCARTARRSGPTAPKVATRSAWSSTWRPSMPPATRRKTSPRPGGPTPT